jgi:hypothetical protein
MSKKVGIGIAAVVVALAWYAFRPELLFIDKSVSESLPSASASTAEADAPLPPLVSGQFKGYAHETEGTAAVYRVGGKNVLRLTNFKTSNGPQLHMYLVAAPDATDDATVKKAGFVDLGPLKGNIGDQNYDIPEGTDLARYQAATVWCARFNVNFGTAPLR